MISCSCHKVRIICCKPGRSRARKERILRFLFFLFSFFFFLFFCFIFAAKVGSGGEYVGNNEDIVIKISKSQNLKIQRCQDHSSLLTFYFYEA